jgi:hypothetical protein
MLEEVTVFFYWRAQGIETMMANGKRNPAVSIMLALLAETARNQTETLRERSIAAWLRIGGRASSSEGPKARARMGLHSWRSTRTL